MTESPSDASRSQDGRLGTLVAELKELRSRLRLGGGEKRIQRQHDQGKLTARERIDRLKDEGAPWVELGLLVAHDRYEGEAPSAGVVTGVGVVEGREVVVVANDATVKAGSWWPETITKMLRAQEVAMRCRIPIIYLVDSAGVNLPYQGGVFPGQYGAARIFYYNSLMRRYLGIPQISAVMGPCIAGGAYLPALSDVILMVEGTSFMGLGGPNLVKGATGQSVGREELGGARVHTEISGVAHFMVSDDEACLARIRELIRELPVGSGAPGSFRAGPAFLPDARDARPPSRPLEEIYDIIANTATLPENYNLLPDEEKAQFEIDMDMELILINYKDIGNYLFQEKSNEACFWKVTERTARLRLIEMIKEERVIEVGTSVYDPRKKYMLSKHFQDI